MNLIFKFFVEFEVDGQVVPVRDLSLIAQNYLKGNFIFDFIPLIPFQLLLSGRYSQLLYFLKYIRIFIGI